MSSAEQHADGFGGRATARVHELARVVPLVDATEPKPSRALTLDESLDLIDSRYREALDLLGTL